MSFRRYAHFMKFQKKKEKRYTFYTQNELATEADARGQGGDEALTRTAGAEVELLVADKRGPPVRLRKRTKR